MKKFVLGFITAAVIFGTGSVYAATGGKMIEVFQNVKSIKFDGVAKTMTSEPFLYKGTTYVPIRFIAENFDKEVKWDSKSLSVLINTKSAPKQSNVAYIGSDVKYMNFQEKYHTNAAKLVYNGETSFLNTGSEALPEGTVAKDNLGNQYTHFLAYTSAYHFDQSESEGLIEFPIDSGFTEFSGTLAIADIFKDTINTIYIEFLVDGNVVYSTNIKAGSFPEKVSFSIKNGKKLSIRTIQSDDASYAANGKAFSIIIGNPIYKK